ncbi:hypothetical protein IAU60_002321 [Kwoniella sp. DSM 27419]
MPAPLPSPCGSTRSNRPAIPLLSLAPPALALGDDLALGEPGEENNAGGIWNVITRAADLVKDGERLENLAWRHWGQPRRAGFDTRRLSCSSQGTASTSSIHTPVDIPHPMLHRSRSAEKLTFGGALRLLLEKDENNFKDWVEDAKKQLSPPSRVPLAAPVLSLPDTPVANLEIRLVEPTPVPSRVGSLGGSMNASGLLGGVATVPPALEEDVEEEWLAERESKTRLPPIKTGSTRSTSPKKKGKFFVQSSPQSKGSGSDSSHLSPVAPPAAAVMPTLFPSTGNRHPPRRRSSGDSSLGKGKPADPPVPAQKRHVSLSTMRGKFQAEKRRMAETLAKDHPGAKKANEESGWEDEDEDEDEEDWSDDEDKPTAPQKGKSATAPIKEVEQVEEPEKPAHLAKLDRRRSTSRPQPARTTSGDKQDLATMLTRRPSQHDRQRTNDRGPPAPPAPTPLVRMSKRERQRAAAERAEIEAQLEAQRQREMFAKKQIFGSKPSQGLLASALQRGASMVNLHSAMDTPQLRPSPTHGQLPCLARSPAQGPSLLRSKSAVAMPVQTGVSVTVAPHALEAAKGRSDSKSSKGSNNSQEKAKAALAAAELESSDEESDDDANYLNTTQTKAKLAALAAKREAKVQSDPNVTAPSPGLPAQALPAGPRLNEFGVVTPMSPTTRRRTIIMSEMSESLRRNVVLEREKSSTGIRAVNGGRARPPLPTHRSGLMTHSSAVNLTQYAQGEPLERHNSHPTRGSHESSQPSSHSGAMPPPPPVEPQRRRTTPNILGGGNFLRPLTRVGMNQPTPKSPSPVQAPLERVQSTTSLASSPNQVVSPGEGHDPEAPAMVRRLTEGDGLLHMHRERERRKELARRRDTTDTSYRLHGW